MIRIDAALRKSGMQSRMLLRVHDELVFELPPQEQEAMVSLVRHEMEHASELSVSLVVDVGIGDSWLATKLA
jgi:DNA polymerase-1